jgi:hypothetical protein
MRGPSYWNSNELERKNKFAKFPDQSKLQEREHAGAFFESELSYRGVSVVPGASDDVREQVGQGGRRTSRARRLYGL